MILCKSLLLFFDGRNILNGPALEKSDLCINRFLGSQSSTKERGPEKKGFYRLYQKITDYTITINGIQ
jgi:hypothetical protein